MRVTSFIRARRNDSFVFSTSSITQCVCERDAFLHDMRLSLFGKVVWASEDYDLLLVKLVYLEKRFKIPPWEFHALNGKLIIYLN